MGSAVSKSGARVLSKTKPTTKIISTLKPSSHSEEPSANPVMKEKINSNCGNVLENESNDKVIMNMNTLMEKEKVPFSSTANQSIDGDGNTRDEQEIRGQAKDLYDAMDPTAPMIQKSYAKYNEAVSILENRKKVSDSELSAEKNGSTETDSVKYRLSTKSLIELLRLTRQDPSKYKDPLEVNTKLNLTHMKNHIQETNILRQYYNTPQLSIRENADGSIDGHWVADIHEFNKSQSMRA